MEQSEQVELLNTIKGVLRQQGKAAEVMGSLEWGTEGPDVINVTITPRKDAVSVSLLVNREVTALLSLFLPLVFGIGGAAIVVDSLQPGVMGMIGILAGGAATGVAAGRAFFTLTGRSLKRRLDGVQQAVSRYVRRGTGA